VTAELLVNSTAATVSCSMQPVTKKLPSCSIMRNTERNQKQVQERVSERRVKKNYPGIIYNVLAVTSVKANRIINQGTQ